jgi:hypothetical protein
LRNGNCFKANLYIYLLSNILTRTLSLKPTGYFKTVQTAPLGAAESWVRKVNRWDLKIIFSLSLSLHSCPFR